MVAGVALVVAASTLVTSGVGALDWFGAGGVISAGLALAFWSFAGIEFACSLAEETRDPRKAIPRGLVWGLVAILAASQTVRRTRARPGY